MDNYNFNLIPNEDQTNNKKLKNPEWILNVQLAKNDHGLNLLKDNFFKIVNLILINKNIKYKKTT